MTEGRVFTARVVQNGGEVQSTLDNYPDVEIVIMEGHLFASAGPRQADCTLYCRTKEIADAVCELAHFNKTVTPSVLNKGCSIGGLPAQIQIVR